VRTTTISIALLAGATSFAAAACGGTATPDTADAARRAVSTSIAAGTAPAAPTTTVSPATTTTTTTAPVAPTTSTTSSVERPSQPIDQLVRIDSGRLHLRCVGSGSRTVVLIAGWDDAGDKWGGIEPAIAERARVCSYSRFGTGTSDAPSATQTFATQAGDLHALLDEAGEPGPYVVVGQSFGGAEAVMFASTYEDEVAGLVLLDASPTTWPAAVCAVPAYEAGCNVMRDPTLDSERLDVFPAFEQVATITSLGDVPMTIMTAAHRDPSGLTAEEVDRLDVVWAAGMDDWASLSSASSVVVVDDSGHHIEVDQPHLVVEELLELLP
jgi:pimeloyl-ACP methyl ester carboxylesterase